MKTIMVATDFSERSDRALRRAILLAKQAGAGITLVHVVDDDQPRSIVESERAEAGELLCRMASSLRDVDGVRCEPLVVLAPAFAGIVRAVCEAAPDLLVIGPHRRRILHDVFVGTTAERVIRSVDCPVLMVNAPPAGPYGHALCATDLSAGSREALRRLGALKLAARARISVLYVFDAPAVRLARIDRGLTERRQSHLEEQRKDAARRLSAFLASTGVRDAETLVRFEETSAPWEILKAAEAEGADLVVLATHGRSGLARLVLGSVAEQVLRASPVDVLAIPPARGE